MPIGYQTQQIGPFKLGLGFTFSLLHERLGVDLGRRFHLDPEYRVQTTLEIDRAIYDLYKEIGVGWDDPKPRPSIEPFGHRFMPVMYGCDVAYNEDSEPWGEVRGLTPSEIADLQPWTLDRFAQAGPVKEVARQFNYLHEKYGAVSAMQNVGSNINTAFSVQGDQIFMDYIMEPELVKKFFANITNMSLVAMEYFADLDKQPFEWVGIGNCSVSMISPEQYLDANREFDLKWIEFARQKGARLIMHQDSDVNAHLRNYAAMPGIKELDFGQDTDFEEAARLFPDADANCLLFPSWINAHDCDEIREELLRLMRAGLKFKNFMFKLYEVDTLIGGDRIFEFYDIFKDCAEAVGQVGK